MNRPSSAFLDKKEMVRGMYASGSTVGEIAKFYGHQKSYITHLLGIGKNMDQRCIISETCKEVGVKCGFWKICENEFKGKADSCKEEKALKGAIKGVEHEQ